MGSQGILTPPIHRPLEGLVLSQLVRDLRESLFGFVQAFIDSVHHTSEGRGLINAGSSTGGLGAASGGALNRFSLVRLLAWVNQPYYHTICHALILLCRAFVCQAVTIARIAPAERTRNSLRSTA